MGYYKDRALENEEDDGRFYSLPERGQKCLCSNHFKSRYLQEHINNCEQKGKCFFCGKAGAVIDLADFINYIGSRLSDYLEDINDAGLPLSSSYYDRDDEVIQGLDKYGDFVALDNNDYYLNNNEAMRCLGLISDNEELNSELFSRLHLENKIRNNPYLPSTKEVLSLAWSDFSHLVKYRQRFTFLKSSSSDHSAIEYSDTGFLHILSELGGMLQTLERVLPVNTFLYRSRNETSDIAVEKFEDITSPPSDRAKSNRMSPLGISMFYGSLDKNTSVQEVMNDSNKPLLYIGEFNTIAELRVIDLCKIPEVDIWMPSKYQEYCFLACFHNEITKPLAKNGITLKSEIEYIPSQIFTEYIREICTSSDGKSYDGIIYKSSITNRPNIVLFYNQQTSKDVLKLNRIEKQQVSRA